MQALTEELDELTDRLEAELKTCKESGCQYAENEAEYRKALRIAILNERQKGTPVTIIGDVCRGQEQIAEAKRRRDCSEAIYKASQEAINVIKLRIRMVDAQITRIWNSGDVTQGGIYEHQRVCISGNLTRDPVLRSTSGGMSVLSMGVAVNDRRKNQQTGQWEDYPNFVDCTLFAPAARSWRSTSPKAARWPSRASCATAAGTTSRPARSAARWRSWWTSWSS